MVLAALYRDVKAEIFPNENEQLLRDVLVSSFGSCVMNHGSAIFSCEW